MTDLSHKPEKAGLFIYGATTGEGGERRWSVVAPYSEGRFGHYDKYYVLPKGSVDHDDFPADMPVAQRRLLTALKEAYEETGIDLLRFLGTAHLDVLLRGQTLTNITSDLPEFAGITIKKFDPTPVHHTYQWHGVAPNPVTLYGVEIAGLEHLRPLLKNRANGNGFGHVEMPVQSRVSDASIYPTVDDLMQWLETGEMPDRPWARGTHASLPPVEGKPFATWFAQLKERLGYDGLLRPLPASAYPRGGLIQDNSELKQRERWEKFNEKIQKAGGEDNRQFRAALKSIKKQMEMLGILDGDTGEIKLDEKDCPLMSYYQEGAELLDMEDYFTYCIERMRANKAYAQAFGGAKASDDYWRPADYLHRSQLAACLPLVPEPVIEQVEQRLQQQLHAERKPWDAPSLRPLPSDVGLHATQKRMARPQIKPSQSWVTQEVEKATAQSMLANPALLG